MKISATLFADLKADCDAMVQHHGVTVETMGNAWEVFHAIQYDRMNDDSHPAFQNGRNRVLPFWSRNGESRDMQGNDHWLNRFYNDENLNDDHIATALRKIFNLKK